jgi:hypothetical protein
MTSILPFETSIGCPQKQLFKLDNVTYSAFYRYNSTADLYTISVRRVSDDVQLYSGKLVEGFYNNIRDDVTKEVLFTLYVRDLKNMEVWII